MIPTPTHAANDYSLAPGQTLASRTGPALQAARTENLSSRRADRERWPQLRVHGRRSMGGRRLQILRVSDIDVTTTRNWPATWPRAHLACKVLFGFHTML